MYLRTLTLENVKQIKNMTLDFVTPREGTPRRLTVLLGRNGTGKTTILRAIGMALGGPTAANQLAAATEFVPLGTAGKAAPAAAQAGESIEGSSTPPWHVRIGVEVATRQVPGDGFDTQRWTVGLTTGSAYFDGDDVARQVDRLRAERRPGMFVAGYGTSRVLPSPMTPFSLSVPIYGQLGSLFDSLEHGRLIATNFSDMLADTKAFARLVQRTLKHPALLPALRDVELRGKGGVTSAASLVESRRFELELGGRAHKVPATWLSHGYQSTIAWVVDLLGRIVVGEHEGRVVGPEDVRGVLLIDEIDLHLHPVWQRTILTGLLEAFPNLQIVATTHSPMVVADLHPDQILLLESDPEVGVVARRPAMPPRMLTAAQLLSEYFGVQRTSAGELHAALEELRRLGDDGIRPTASRRRPKRSRAQVLRGMLEAAGVNVDAWLRGEP